MARRYFLSQGFYAADQSVTSRISPTASPRRSSARKGAPSGESQTVISVTDEAYGHSGKRLKLKPMERLI